MRSRRTLIPITTQNPVQVSRCCQDRRPGGGHNRLSGTATDQTAPANIVARINTATPNSRLDTTPYRFGFGAIATSSTRSPSDTFATPCGSPGSDHATPPGPRSTHRSPTVNRPSPSIT